MITALLALVFAAHAFAEITYTKIPGTDFDNCDPIERIGTPNPCGVYYGLPPCNISYLEDACRNTCGCGGFNSNGWLKGCVQKSCGAIPEQSKDTDTYVGSSRAYGPSKDLPQVDDWHYPVEEPAENATAIVPALISVNPTSNSTGTAVFQSSGDQVTASVGDLVFGWLFVSFAGAETVVLERRFSRWSALAWVTTSGVVWRTRSGVGLVSGIETPRYNQPLIEPCYFEHAKEATEDYWLSKLPSEPTFTDFASLMAPMHEYAVIGNPEGWTKWVVSVDGFIKHAEDPIYTPTYPRGVSQPGSVVFSALNVSSYWPSDNFTDYKNALVGGHSRVVTVAAWDRRVSKGWRMTTYSPRPNVVYVAFEDVAEGSEQEGSATVQYFEASDTASVISLDGGVFWGELLPYLQTTRAFWVSDLHLPGQEGARLRDSTRSTLLSSMTLYTYEFVPNYGFGLYYWSNTTDRGSSLPLTTLALDGGLLAHGQLTAAQDRVGYYLDNYVRDDGFILMTGWKTECPFPDSFADYGRMVQLFVDVARASDAAVSSPPSAWTSKNLAKGLALVNYTLSLQNKAANSSTGLVHGPAEHDTCQDEEDYFSISAWTIRGLIDASRWLNETNQDPSLASTCARGATTLQNAMDQQIKISTVVDNTTNEVFLPPFAGPGQTPFQTMTESVVAEYSNFRYYPEMLLSGVFSEQVSAQVLEYRQNHGGFISAMARWSDHLDSMPQLGTFITNLELNNTERLVQLLTAHSANYIARGNFGGTEQISFWNDVNSSFRSYLAAPSERDMDFCVPSTSLMALQVRHALVHARWNKDEVLFGWGAPRRWYSATGLESIPPLPQGAPTIKITDAITRYGNISFAVTPSDTTNAPASFQVNLDFVFSGYGFVSGGTDSPTLGIKIRDPNIANPRPIASASVTAGPATVTSFDEETIFVKINQSRGRSQASITIVATMKN